MRGTMKRSIGRSLVAVLAAAVGWGLAPAAHAQVPELPPEVTDQLATVQDTTFPVLVQVATASQPVMTVGGFVFRPVCGSPGTSLVLVLALQQVPLQPGFVSTPLNLVCAGAFGIGPADAVFAAVDGAAGQQLQASLDPVLDQVGAGLEPARPNLAQACSVIGLAAPPTYFMPMPVGRFDVTREVCGP
jgi:hypothetical protein